MSWFKITFIVSCFFILLSFRLYELPVSHLSVNENYTALTTTDFCLTRDSVINSSTLDYNSKINDCFLLYHNNFDDGWGIWNDGGADSYLVSGFGVQNSKSIRIRDNSGSSSSAYTEIMNLSMYSEIQLAFSYLVFGMDNGEQFYFEVSDDGGENWEILQTWVCGIDFNINQRKEVTEVFGRNFSSTTRIRFRSDATSNSDRVFLDEISISGCEELMSKSTNEDFSWSSYAEQIKPATIISKGTVEFNFKNDFSIYPNPSFDKVYFNFDLVTNDVEFKSAIYDPSGKLIKSGFVNSDKFKKSSTKLELNISDFAEGIYYVKISMNDHVSIKKLMIAR